MNKDQERLLQAAGEVCIKYYMAHHVSEMHDKTEVEKKLWSIGQELRFIQVRGTGDK